MNTEYSDRFLLAARPSGAADASDPRTILHTAYEAVIRGDFDAFGRWVTDDVELNICGLAHLDGSWRGRTDVVAATRRNFGEIESQQPEIESMVHQGDCIAVLLRETGVFKLRGEAYSIRGVQWFTFAEGKIRKIDQVTASIWKAGA